MNRLFHFARCFTETPGTLFPIFYSPKVILLSINHKGKTVKDSYLKSFSLSCLSNLKRTPSN